MNWKVWIYNSWKEQSPHDLVGVCIERSFNDDSINGFSLSLFGIAVIVQWKE